MEHKPMVVVTSIRIPQRTWLLLRALAEQRALEIGGKASVSAIVAELAEKADHEAPHA